MSDNDQESDLELEYSSSSSESENGGPVFDGEGDENDRAGMQAAAGHEVQFGMFEPRRRVAENNIDGNAENLPIIRQIDENRLLNNDWCTCGHCQIEPSFKAGDCLCCNEIPEVMEEVRRYENQNCITTCEPFEPAILHPISLYIGWYEYTDKWRQAALNFAGRNNEKYRYVAYRKLVRWCWGWLGENIRVQTPACAHSTIMRTYPDRRGVYKGTILRPLEVE